MSHPPLIQIMSRWIRRPKGGFKLLTQTKYFGEVEYNSGDILQFKDGLFGFESEHHFLLLPFAGSDATLLCLQSLTTPTLAFVLMNPFSLNVEYIPILPQDALQAMGVEHSEELCYYVLCVVRNPVSSSTVNLKCPVVINDQSRESMQVILEVPEYEMRHPLSSFGPREAERLC